MDMEKRLADFVVDAKYEDLPKETVEMAKAITMNIIGTTVGGGVAEGTDELIKLVKGWGGKKEATIFIYGCKVPAHNAVLVNSYMARALDFESGGAPGAHPAATYIPVALAAAELRDGINGKDFLTAVIAGSEIGYRMNAATNFYGLDPTGYGPVFSAAAVAGKILGLNKKQMLDALGIAFNRQAGSFQANIDGTLCVRLIQSFTSQSGLLTAILAQRGFNGVKNFIEGIYGHFALYSRDNRYDPDILVGDLGQKYSMVENTVFKRCPSCGATLTAADIASDLAKEHGLKSDDVAEITIKLGGLGYELVGHPFTIGDTPKVNAQFNVRYVVANVLTRGEPKLTHFDEGAVRELDKTGLIEKISVGRGATTGETEMVIKTKKGEVYRKTQRTFRGRPDDPLTREERMATFWQCVKYGGKPLPKGNPEKIIAMIDKLEELPDVCELIPLLVAQPRSLR